MKILLISDSHSNIDALNAVDAAEKDYDRVWFAGDMVDYGFFPHEVIEWMKQHQTEAVYGNHDEGILKLLDDGFKPYDDPFEAKSFAEYNLSVMTEEDIDFLRSLPKTRTFKEFGTTYYMQHIYMDNSERAFYEDLGRFDYICKFDEFWKNTLGQTDGGKCYVVGHSHHCHWFNLGQNRSIINPGSVSYRVGADTVQKTVDYIIIDNGTPILKSTSCNTDYCYDMVLKTSFREWEKETGKSIFQTK